MVHSKYDDNDKEEMDTEEIQQYHHDYLDGCLVKVVEYTSGDIKKLLYSLKEEQHNSRQRSGRFIFWGWMRSIFNELNGAKKIEFVNGFFLRHPTVYCHIEQKTMGGSRIIINDTHEEYYKVSHHDV